MHFVFGYIWYPFGTLSSRAQNFSVNLLEGYYEGLVSKGRFSWISALQGCLVAGRATMSYTGAGTSCIPNTVKERVANAIYELQMRPSPVNVANLLRVARHSSIKRIWRDQLARSAKAALFQNICLFEITKSIKGTMSQHHQQPAQVFEVSATSREHRHSQGKCTSLKQPPGVKKGHVFPFQHFIICDLLNFMQLGFRCQSTTYAAWKRKVVEERSRLHASLLLESPG